MTAVLDLRRSLAERFPGALPLVYRTAGAVPTGLLELDHLLPNGGFPRGRITVWAPGGGATAVLRAACAASASRGERAAWVESGERLVLSPVGAGVVQARSPGPVEALAAGEELARSGGFGLVVVSVGEVARSGVVAGAVVRLTRAAKEGGGALVIVSAESGTAHLRVHSHVTPESVRWRTDPFGAPAEPESVVVAVAASSLGWSGSTRVELPVRSHRVRTAPDPLLVDRRGTKPRVRRRWRRRATCP